MHRWDTIDKRYDAEMDHQMGCTTRPIRMNNTSAEPVDTLTQRYLVNEAGIALKHEDDRVKWRGEIRRETLWRKQQSQHHNIITGEPVVCPVTVPPEP